MKTARDFIIDRLQSSAVIQKLSVHYWHDPVVDFHLVEIEPFEEGDKIVDYAYDFLMEFEAQYPDTDLIIGSSEPVLRNNANLIYRNDTIEVETNLPTISFVMPEFDNHSFNSICQTPLAA